MSETRAQHELIVFPTELALRRFQQEEALKHGWVDASGHTTFPRLRKLCLTYASVKGLRMNAAQQLLIRRQVVEVAMGHFHGEGALGELSPNALADVLDQLITELASLPGETARVVDWLLDHHRKHKLYQLGMLFSVWRATIKQDGFADAIDVNTALLKLLNGPRDQWPPQLRDCSRVTFRSVRWFNPFEERCVSALNKKLKVRVESALPQAHAEVSADRMGQQIRSEIMDKPWAVWAEDLGDALAVDSADVLQLSDVNRINFSRSAGAYGEIEDLARRICWNLQTLNVSANRVALIVPNIGNVQDIIPHVFSRFQIPYFFRRGRPVLSSPCVKAFFAWLAFPLRPERDTLIDLVRNPAIRFEHREQEIERLMKQPPRLEADASDLSGFQALEILTERIVKPEDHFNDAALKVVATVLEQIGNHSLPLSDLIDLLEELLENETVRPRESHEQGVWILNPHDAVGLDFDVVLFAGLNEGAFPGVPQQDALLSDHERHFLKLHLEEQGRHLPKMALPEADVLFEQESVLFLTALGMAREQLVFSYQSVDQEGNDKGEGEFYRKLWNLAGWCAQEEMQLSPYDQWRIQTLETDSIFSNHWKSQQSTAPEDRLPMPGESFLPIIPLPLCRAKDEALQAAVKGGQTRKSTPHVEQTFQSAHPVVHLIKMLKIEAEREAYLDTPIDEREPSIYCGHVPALKEKIAVWFEEKEEMSPTALEALAQCRYIFLIERIFGIRDPRVADDTPDPMERGGLIHSILHEIYTAIALGHSGIDAPRYWAVKSSNGWKLRTEEGVEAIPLATFVPEFGSEYEAFARRIANRRLNSAALGHPGVWAAEREKILEMVLNFVRYDAETCAAEKRYPALFELKFGGETAVDLEQVKLHGVIDRVDLIFADTGDLAKVRVLDYKGSSRSRSKTEEYVEEIIRNLDCQLPVYAFAAQQYFFETFNNEAVNVRTDAGYLFYERDFPRIGSSLKKSLVAMDEPNLTAGFMATLFSNLDKLKNADFAVDPLIETYTDYMSVCRTEAVDRGDVE
ncbi:PD-(D/E)XK nuclease family protein [Pontiellaceae bacterium B1224]|nr:PD-(D/E)XK nuclease family protein [Pontiellaceae bacterium B1224]